MAGRFDIWHFSMCRGVYVQDPLWVLVRRKNELTVFRRGVLFFFLFFSFSVVNGHGQDLAKLVDHQCFDLIKRDGAIYP